MKKRLGSTTPIIVGAAQFFASYIVFVLVTAAVLYLILQLGKRTTLLPGDWFLATDLPAAASLITMTAGLAPATLIGGFLSVLVSPRLKYWSILTPIVILCGAYLSSLPLGPTNLATGDLAGVSSLLAMPSGAAGSWLAIEIREGPHRNGGAGASEGNTCTRS